MFSKPHWEISPQLQQVETSVRGQDPSVPCLQNSDCPRGFIEVALQSAGAAVTLSWMVPGLSPAHGIWQS